ncbi:MAG TPA: hypothetical protein VG895_05500 [Patescibacteria group bacterium]|nr:hypothetical protein [Patescibacteria group bacterium]
MSCECAILTRAEQLAHQKGLLPHDEHLKCEFKNVCEGQICFKEYFAETRHININGQEAHPLNAQEAFNSRLQKTHDINHIQSLVSIGLPNVSLN